MPKQHTLFDPNEADADSVRLWMQAGLDAYFKQDVGRWAFRPLEHYVDVRGNLAEDMQAIYQGLTPHAQERWRFAMRDLLAIQGRDLSKRKATRVILNFVALARAHEVLDVLPTLVARGTEPSLLHHVVRTAVALASPTDAARACLERIHSSPSFSPDYAGVVLTALCHVDPDGWLSHVENLAQPMDVLASRLADHSTALRFYASCILDAISLSRVDSVSLRRLSGAPGSAWLWREWLTGPKSLLCYEEDAGPNCRISLRGGRGTVNAAAPSI